MRFEVEVVQVVEVSLDETMFNEKFMEEFRKGFYSFHTLRDHVEHLAQLEARGLVGTFLEGYGRPDEVGISFEILAQYIGGYEEDTE